MLVRLPVRHQAVLVLVALGALLLFLTSPVAAQQPGGGGGGIGGGGVSIGGGGGGAPGGTFGSGSFGSTFGSGSFGSSFGQGQQQGGGILGSFGGTGAGAGGRAGGAGASGIPSSANPFQATYAHPVSLGAPGNNANAPFGTPIFDLNTTGGNRFGNTQGIGGGANYGGGAGIAGGAGIGGGGVGITTGAGGVVGSGAQGRLGGGLTGTTGVGGVVTGQLGAGQLGGLGSGTRRPLPYLSSQGFTIPAAATRLQTDVRQVIGRSTAITNRDNIQVEMEGATVVLRGIVADERERRMTESMARMTPGVRDVRNELQVPAPATPQ